jgi:hypothetical protein
MLALSMAKDDCSPQQILSDIQRHTIFHGPFAGMCNQHASFYVVVLENFKGSEPWHVPMDMARTHATSGIHVKTLSCDFSTDF